MFAWICVCTFCKVIFKLVLGRKVHGVEQFHCYMGIRNVIAFLYSYYNYCMELFWSSHWFQTPVLSKTAVWGWWGMRSWIPSSYLQCPPDEPLPWPPVWLPVCLQHSCPPSDAAASLTASCHSRPSIRCLLTASSSYSSTSANLGVLPWLGGWVWKFLWQLEVSMEAGHHDNTWPCWSLGWPLPVKLQAFVDASADCVALTPDRHWLCELCRCTHVFQIGAVLFPCSSYTVSGLFSILGGGSGKGVGFFFFLSFFLVILVSVLTINLVNITEFASAVWRHYMYGSGISYWSVQNVSPMHLFLCGGKGLQRPDQQHLGLHRHQGDKNHNCGDTVVATFAVMARWMWPWLSTMDDTVLFCLLLWLFVVGFFLFSFFFFFFFRFCLFSPPALSLSW